MNRNGSRASPLDLDLESLSSRIRETDDESENSSFQGSSFRDEDTTTRDKSQSSSNEEYHKLNVAKKETNAVFCLRLWVFFVLLLASTAVSLLVYFVTRSSEQQEYEAQYDGAAKKILETFLEVASTRLGMVSSLAVTLTSNANDLNQQWPFSTMSNFQQRAANIRDNSGCVYLHVNPFVVEGDRKKWEEFVGQESYSTWIDEGLAYQNKIGLFEYDQEAHGGNHESDHMGHGEPDHSSGTGAHEGHGGHESVEHGDHHDMSNNEDTAALLGHEGHGGDDSDEQGDHHDMHQGGHTEEHSAAPSNQQMTMGDHTGHTGDGHDMIMDHTGHTEAPVDHSGHDMTMDDEDPVDHSDHGMTMDHVGHTEAPANHHTGHTEAAPVGHSEHEMTMDTEAPMGHSDHGMTTDHAGHTEAPADHDMMEDHTGHTGHTEAPVDHSEHGMTTEAPVDHSNHGLTMDHAGHTEAPANHNMMENHTGHMEAPVGHSYHNMTMDTEAPMGQSDHGMTADHSGHIEAPVEHDMMEDHTGHTEAPVDRSDHGMAMDTEAPMGHTDQDHSGHAELPVDHSEHGMAMDTEAPVDHSDHGMTMDHAGHTEGPADNDTMEDHTGHTEAPVDHSDHGMTMDHAGHSGHRRGRVLKDTNDNHEGHGDAHHDHDEYLALMGEGSWSIWYHNDKKEVAHDDGPGPYMPTWQSSPIFYQGHETNENILKSFGRSGGYRAFSTESAVISEFLAAPAGNKSSLDPQTALYARLLSANLQETVEYHGDPFSQVFFPIFDSLDDNKTAVGVVVAWIHWMTYFTNILPPSLESVHLVIDDSCGQAYTYEIDGGNVNPLGKGDLHDTSFDETRRSSSFATIQTINDGTQDGLPLNQDECSITVAVYSTEDFYKSYNTATPVIMTCAVALIFVFTALMFKIYDWLVERRQRLVMRKATQTDKIVASLFPKNVRDRLMKDVPEEQRSSSFLAPNRKLKGYLTGSEEDNEMDAPIADLFPYCTVCFSDIAGFTAWSSTRDPAQVFILLQTVYQAFDRIAKRRKVFKVETIGDSYVAVTGLPEAQANHAIIMARFAAECNTKMQQLTAQLENSLGPDTADLAMRFGLHSGPVTAGVLRGDRARFQLFGDTVNTASRMESTGKKNRIQISPATHDLLVKAGKQGWVRPRSDAVEAKGKGTIKTYWMEIRTAQTSSTGDNSSKHSAESAPFAPSVEQQLTRASLKQERLVNWMVDMFREHIRKLQAVRGSNAPTSTVEYVQKQNLTSLDEVAEVIYLPRFDERAHVYTPGDERNVVIDNLVVSQLRAYISIVASYYRDNPFHNFEHACHVTMATNKFLKRIVAPDIAIKEAKNSEIANKLHNYTHGINSDPLTILAILFSALIHDADHQGVSNAQLATENPALKDKYRNKSIAEQNSLDLAWDLLMQDKFVDLRNSLFTNESELKRFRQVLVNVVLATDIFDKELNGLRKNRWDKAFSSEVISDEENTDLRATIVIEHIIQASDVSHTMQHWHIYRKWNRRLFVELYKAYCEGRMGADPAKFWYKGEIGFFDNYIIPLAKKLKDCQVFGVSSDECLNYALQNRNEWEERGQQIVEDMLEEIQVSNRVRLSQSNTPEEMPQKQLKEQGPKALEQPQTKVGQVPEVAKSFQKQQPPEQRPDEPRHSSTPSPASGQRQSEIWV